VVEASGENGNRMSVFGEAFSWLFDPANRYGNDGVLTCVWQHLELSAAGLGAALVLAVPVGLVTGHARSRWGENVAVQLANAARAVPTFAVLSLVYVAVLQFAPQLAFGFVPTVVALAVLGVPPILVNTTVGLREVDADVKEAAAGMGFTGGQTLRGVELPLSMPLIVTGVRIAALQIVATATLSAFIGGSGLGRLIRDGYARQDRPMMIAGVYLVATLAIATEGLFWLGLRVAAPTGVGRNRRGP
jgi:osmoprotectant transport system permease protein